MATTMIDVQGLTKYYGDFLALDNLTFTAYKGEILGLLGANGSGKTTTMRILTGFMPATSGTALVANADVHTQSLEVRRNVGYLPESVPLYTDMRVVDYLSYMGQLRGMRRQAVHRRVAEVVEQCQLTHYAHTLIGRLSKGYRQRVGIGQAILHEPPVLILDEPTIGIDPGQIVETRGLIRELAKGHTVLLSTHILPEVSALCQRVIIIHEGSLVAIDTPDNLARRTDRAMRVELQVKGPSGDILRILGGLPDVVRVSQDRSKPAQAGSNTYIVEHTSGDDIREKLAQTVIAQGWGLTGLTVKSVGLEELFLRLTHQEETSEVKPRHQKTTPVERK